MPLRLCLGLSGRTPIFLFSGEPSCAGAVDHFLSFQLIFLESMASNRGQGGIQQLLTAEQEAQHIVNAARSAKMARLKQAKDEAEREIAETRSQVELQFQKKVAAQSSGDSGANVKRLEHETEHKINHLSSEASRISSDVVQMLLKQVTTVKV
ncbi:hypothetical protein L3X38_015981 [Prunus dulcis]|uniref:V-type proton ATPase subunit G n=2 Tax=Prunus TaxID=3754 RepID=A0AAD4Z9D1_PRUDU|nr:hypothetical protein L3X38_015981 [Prunus dulcis]